MGTQISPLLTVSDENAAISFYKAAFGATVGWYMDPTGQLIAGLSIDGTLFFLSREVPPAGRRSSTGPGVVPVKIQLFVDDPVAAHRKAVAAGAVEREPVQGYEGERNSVARGQADGSRHSCRSIRTRVGHREDPGAVAVTAGATTAIFKRLAARASRES